MDDSSMNKTIHEFLGKCGNHEWIPDTRHPKAIKACKRCGLKTNQSDTRKLLGVPDYTNCLNAIRTAELKVIEKFGEDAYVGALMRVLIGGPKPSDKFYCDVATADAKTRAVAIVDVIEGDEK